jgi:hypothetical protein
MKEFRGRKRERTRWMKEGRIRKGAYKGMWLGAASSI